MSFGTEVSDLPPSRKGSRAAPRRCPIFSGRQLPRSALACQVTTPAQSLGHHWRAWGVRWGSAPLCTQAWTSTDPAAPPRWTLPVTERREERGLLADLPAREQICGPPQAAPFSVTSKSHRPPATHETPGHTALPRWSPDWNSGLPPARLHAPTGLGTWPAACRARGAPSALGPRRPPPHADGGRAAGRASGGAEGRRGRRSAAN